MQRNTSGFNFEGTILYATIDGVMYRQENSFLGTREGASVNFEERLVYTGITERDYDLYGNKLVRGLEYDLYNGVDTFIDKGAYIDMKGDTIIARFILDRSDAKFECIFHNVSTDFDSEGAGICVLGDGRVGFFKPDNSGTMRADVVTVTQLDEAGISDGDMIEVICNVNDYTDATGTINGLIPTQSAGIGANVDQYIIGARNNTASSGQFKGVIIQLDRNGVDMRHGGTKNGVFGTALYYEPFVLDTPLTNPAPPEQGYNYFDYFNGTDASVDGFGDVPFIGNDIKAIFELDTNLVGNQVIMDNYDSGSDTGIAIYYDSNGRLGAISYTSTTGGIYREGRVYSEPGTYTVEVKNLVSVNSFEVYINGVRATDGVLSGFGFTFDNGLTIGARSDDTIHHTGVIETLSIGASEYNTFNAWNGGTKNNITEQRLIYTGITKIGYDRYGTPLLGYNLYDYYDGISSTVTMNDGGHILYNSVLEVTFVMFEVPTATLTIFQTQKSGVTAVVRLSPTTISFTTYNGSIYQGKGVNRVLQPSDIGTVFHLVATIGADYDTFTVTINNETITNSVAGGFVTNGNTLFGSRGADQFFNGIVFNVKMLGVDYNTANNAWC
jgi:hypothetical protein